MRRNLYVGATFVALLVVLGVGSSMLGKRAAIQAATTNVMAPRFEVNPLWPKPLPNHWLMGQTIGVSVDASDHIWVIHRGGSLEPGEQHATTNPPTAQCCAPAPPILEFDEEGNLIGHWGGPGQGYTGRSQTTASRWIIKATYGSAATAAARRRAPPGGAGDLRSWTKARWPVFRVTSTMP